MRNIFVSFGVVILLLVSVFSQATPSSSGFEVFPNPAQNVINFNYTVNGAVEVELSNALGSAVSTTEGTSMNVAELPAGVYFATLKVNGVSTAVQRVEIK